MAGATLLDKEQIACQKDQRESSAFRGNINEQRRLGRVRTRSADGQFRDDVSADLVGVAAGGIDSLGAGVHLTAGAFTATSVTGIGITNPLETDVSTINAAVTSAGEIDMRSARSSASPTATSTRC